jgi:hypothetical protein
MPIPILRPGAEGSRGVGALPVRPQRRRSYPDLAPPVKQTDPSEKLWPRWALTRRWTITVDLGPDPEQSEGGR